MKRTNLTNKRLNPQNDLQKEKGWGLRNKGRVLFWGVKKVRHKMFGGNLTNHEILFGRKKVGRRAEGGTVVGQKMVTIV